MRQLAAKQLSGILEAYAQRDVARARAIWLGDVEMDALEDSLFRDMLTFMMEDAGNVPFCTHLLFSSKNLERIGDHATNIAEMVVWMVTGESMPIERPKKRLWLYPSGAVTHQETCRPRDMPCTRAEAFDPRKTIDGLANGLTAAEEVRVDLYRCSPCSGEVLFFIVR